MAKEFIANNISSALKLVKAEFGPDAIILSQKSLNGKIHLYAVAEHEILEPQTVNSDAMQIPPLANLTLKKPVTKQMPIESFFSDPTSDELPAKEDVFSSTYLSTPSKQGFDVSLKNDVTDIIKNELESVKELLKNQQSENMNQDFDVKSELEGIKELLKAQVLHPASKSEENDQHSLHISMSRILYQKRFQSMMINNILAQIPTDISLDNAWKIFISQIVDMLKFSKSELSTAKKIKTLIGPSGVGKTLLLAKILVYFANKPLKNNFSIIFVNNSNLKVLEESKIYERIFNVPTYYVENLDELERAYHKSFEKDHIFIDFPPFDFHNAENNFYMRFLEKYSAEIDNTFVISPHCNFSYIERYFTAFKNIEINGLTITKLDECNSLEEILSYLISNQVPLRHLSFGNLSFSQGFSSKLLIANKNYFHDYLTNAFLTKK